MTDYLDPPFRPEPIIQKIAREVADVLEERDQLRARVARLTAYIKTAPCEHRSWPYLSQCPDCDCWKRAALTDTETDG